MAVNVVGKIPEFTSDETPSEEAGAEEVKKAAAEEVAEEEKETPSELPAEEKPAGEPGVDTGELLAQVRGLQEDRDKLFKEIQELRGTRREIKREEFQQVEQKLDELKDLHPEDVSVVDRIVRGRGYMTRDEIQKMYYESVKQQQLNAFLEKYPEYKRENDSNDLNWNSLQREMGYYRMPDDPHRISEVLDKAHRAIQKVPSDRSIPAKQRQVQVAGVGAGGAQRSSSGRSLSPQAREEFLRGGWSEEEIRQMEKNLPE